MLPAMSAGGPFVLTAQGSSGGPQTVHDVLVGDVFLCSGQSNMELPVGRAGDTDSEIRDSRNDTIRMITVEHASSAAPQTDFASPVAWQSATPETVPAWSAACFFFARELQKTVRVPLGLVHASWGGSNIRPWMSAAALHANGGYESALGLLTLHATDPVAAQSQFGREWEQWWRGKTGDRVGAEPWSAGKGAAPGWRPAPAKLGDWRTWGVAELKDFTGLVWYRTHITLSAVEAKAANRLDLGAINQVDQTWINGRIVGNTFGYGTDRTYNIAPGLLHAGDNVLVINVLCNYGGGGLLEGGARRAVQLTDGRSIPLDGPWEYRIAPSAIGYPPRAPWESVGGLTSLYNAMIAPLGHYALRGALWYQGESNTGEAESYPALLAGLMADWRHQFGAALPFLIVQLPNYGKLSAAPEESGWAELREAQRQTVAKDPHAGLTVTIDIGDAHNLHPTNKQDVGRRLALAARHVIYGESIAPSGPVALSAVRADGRVVVGFGDVENHLVTYSHDTPIGFELCGDGPGTCQFAEARLEGTRVVLGSRNGAPVSRVRYCWADSPICTLFDASGLPAGPFEMRISGGADAGAAGSAVAGSAAADVSQAAGVSPLAQTTATQDSAAFDPDGTAHVTRVVPEPMLISPEARKWLDSTTRNQHGPQTLEQRRAATDEWRARDSAEALKQYPVTIKETTIAGVRADLITPLLIPPENQHRVLINLHGGGFNSDSGSRIEGDPIANLAKIQVVSVYYRLAPEHPFPAALDDVVAVYKELLKTYKPRSIGIFGTSAGGILTCEVAVKLKQLGLPLPGAMAVLSALGDFSRVSDSRQLFTLDGFPGTLQPTDPGHLPDDAYVGKTDRRDPVLSPVFADLKGMPPALFVSGTRDMLLGDTSTLHRAMLHAGVDSRLVVFDALPHAFWYHFEFPETREALQLTADFLAEKVAR
jgi:sialate O-acetylesterase